MLTAVTHETIDCRSIFETHYTTLTTSPPPPTIEESSYFRITMYSRSYHRSSHLQRSTGSAWFIARIELIPNLVRFFSIPFFFFCFEKKARRGKAKPRGKDDTRGTFDGKSRRNSNGARVFRITHGTYRFKYTERACAMPRPRRPETALLVSPSLSPSSFRPRLSFLLR